jgi:hypothetical protein
MAAPEQRQGPRATTPEGLYLRQFTGVGEETGLPTFNLELVDKAVSGIYHTLGTNTSAEAQVNLYAICLSAGILWSRLLVRR